MTRPNVDLVTGCLRLLKTAIWFVVKSMLDAATTKNREIMQS